MTLEIYRPIEDPKKTAAINLKPGEKAHIVSIDAGGYEKIYEIQVREDDVLSTVHVLRPLAITDGPRPIAIYDDNLTENRSYVIKKGQILDLNIRQLRKKKRRTVFEEDIVRLQHI